MLCRSSGCTSLTSGDPLDADHTFVHRLVSQPRRTDEIADRIDAGFAGAQPFVDDNMASVDHDAGVFKPDVFDIADDPDGEDHALDADLGPLPFSLDSRDDVPAVALQCGDGGTGIALVKSIRTT